MMRDFRNIRDFLIKVVRLSDYFFTENFNRNKEIFISMKQRYQVNKQRERYGLPPFPQPEEILHAPYCFILSTGRCGTGLITKILKKSPHLLVHHTPKPELEYVFSLIHRTKPSIESLKLAILAARFDLFFLEAFRRGKIFVETNPRITFFAPALSELLPNAKFIHLIRNPADFVRSGMRRQYYVEGNIQHQRLNPIENPEWLQMNLLEKVAWEWNEINMAIDNFKEVCPPHRLIIVKSEDLFKQEELVSTLFKFLEIPNPFSTASGSKRLKKLLNNPVNKQISGNFPKYHDWTDNEKASLKRIATLAEKYGYNLL